MTTSLRDLVTTLHHETRRTPVCDPGTAAKALQRTGALLDRLRADAVAADPGSLRSAAARRLADACATAALTFEPTGGRQADLVGVITDVVGVLRDELTDEDRWAIAVAIATPVRRFAAAIGASGPYAHVPQLLAIVDRCGELVRVAAQDPPAPAAFGAMDRPIPWREQPSQPPVGRVAAEVLADLGAELHRHDHEPRTIRQLLAVCLIAEQIANLGRDHALRNLNTNLPHSWQTTGLAWRDARRELARFADRPVQSGNGARLLRCAARGIDELRHAADGHALPAESRRHETAWFYTATSQLPRLADECRKTLRNNLPALVVAGGSRPLHEDRVSEWLKHRAFLPTHHDLLPAERALGQAALASRELAGQLALVVHSDRAVSLPGWAPRPGGVLADHASCHAPLSSPAFLTR